MADDKLDFKLDFDNTSQITIPTNIFERIIGQDEAVKIAMLIPAQRRHLLLVGPPGTGKSMIAQAIASVLPKPKQEIAIVHNESQPERPTVELRDVSQVQKEKIIYANIGTIVTPLEVPTFVAEKLGFRCARCGTMSAYNVSLCPNCGAEKYVKNLTTIEREIFATMGVNKDDIPRVSTTRRTADGKQETIIYDRTADGRINMLTQNDIKKMNEINKKSLKRIIVPLSRSTFVQTSGANETELLGDVRHDPYGGHFQLGTPPYLRVVAGAVHEAHEGVLYIDEVSTLGFIQRHLLTAMQEKMFPIIGRNPTSSGANVRVDAVPCDFIFVGSVNINDLGGMIPALRSRIRGDGYEILMRSYMEDNPGNRYKLAQFVAQEIAKDGRIPHASVKAVEEIVHQAKKIAKTVDKANGLTLRLRNLSGIIKLAGDLAKTENSEFIEAKHVVDAITNSKSIEEQVRDKYDSWYSAANADFGVVAPKGGAETA